MLRVPQVAVFPVGALGRNQRLLEALAQLYSVKFVPGGELRSNLYEAAVFFGTTREIATRAAKAGLRSLAFLWNGAASDALGPGEVRLATCSYLERALRGASLPDTALGPFSRMEPKTGDQVVAWKDGSALWIHRPEGASAVDYVAMPVPELGPSDYVFPYFTTNNWIRVFPLFHFVKEISRWKFPPVRSCFMFDDPNLHWKSYGYIRYDELLTHTRKRNYHVCLATIPLDGWYAHSETTALFRENPQRFSLLIHGNNHTYYELMNVRTIEAQRAVAAQALRRIRHFEEKHALEVARVMAAPHGACDQDMAAALWQVGFDAACISRSSIMARNPGTQWLPTVGLNPAEFLGGALPVIPRFNVRWDLETYVRFAAFLGQPIIPVGHHEDAADGFALLDRFASLVNSIGDVQWIGMKAMAESNYWFRSEGDSLLVRAFSRRIRLRVPERVRQISVHRVWLDDNQGEGLTLLRQGAIPQHMASYHGEFIPVCPGEELVANSTSRDLIDPITVPISAPSLWAVARRQLSEGRDRTKPIIDKLFRRNPRRVIR